MTDEQLYKIGEVARLLDVNSSVLRYWETEFPRLTPVRTEGGQRLYTPAHLVLLKEIKRLLYDEKRTIQGARQALEAQFPAQPGSTELTSPPGLHQTDPHRDLLLEITAELRAIRRLLEDE
ncbi:MerR family transcriptional regulator [Megalodesulfovibrio gigas]|uniref:Putative transcriptional regulator n=1 Tax=Megalodesulfovibrio gigas (strain ATCC 19364 / DSM 1382 / NCIMB 9332 / VKM B-1759) TaxID=1121448 RepID=T2GBB9_MEGG1|nr:MerR family transcriptional regulator [Megalodesulfovibrio gigas]AGW13202.1 putative transcriptional regulator [Megalodesulfovibrio gigas DSM 1382 = ATCC 19364]